MKLGNYEKHGADGRNVKDANAPWIELTGTLCHRTVRIRSSTIGRSYRWRVLFGESTAVAVLVWVNFDPSLPDKRSCRRTKNPRSGGEVKELVS